MFDNLKNISRSFGAAGSYAADRLEHLSLEANMDDAISISKKLALLQQEGASAVHLFNNFQKGKKLLLEVEATDIPTEVHNE